jgi:uncharacterized membrane protein
MGSFLFVVLLLPNIAYRGYVLAQLWAWFMVPFGLPVIGVAHAIGVSVLIGMCSVTIARETSADEKADMYLFRSALLGPVITTTLWLEGAIVHYLM